MSYLLDANVFIQAKNLNCNVCAGLKLRCMTPYQMLRIEQARFVLGREA